MDSGRKIGQCVTCPFLKILSNFSPEDSGGIGGAVYSTPKDYLYRKWCNPAPLNGSAPNLVVVDTDRQGQQYYK